MVGAGDASVFPDGCLNAPSKNMSLSFLVVFLATVCPTSLRAGVTILQTSVTLQRLEGEQEAVEAILRSRDGDDDQFKALILQKTITRRELTRLKTSKV